MSNSIQIEGAKVHNLKNLDLNIPRDELVVITGLSGSGKSSLAFDTIYAEGQRRYMETFSAYIVSKAKDDLPLPDKPVITTNSSLGIFKSRFLRLWTFAPSI